MSTPVEALAVTPQNHNEPAQLQATRQAELIASSAVVLDRANLAFFADMIEAADLIPYDKNVPKSVQKFRVMSKIVAGVAHDFDPISSQENLHVIQGRCVLSARGMAIKLRRTRRYDTRVEKLDNDGCKLAVLEKNDEGSWILKGHVEFTRADADKAKLTTSNAAMYDKWGPDMFYANAIKRVCRRFAPEVLDTKPVLYDTAKRPSLSADDTPPTPQLGVGTSAPDTEPEPSIGDMTPPPSTEVGQAYTDQPYSGNAPSSLEETDSVIDDGFKPTDPAESRREDLLTAAKEAYKGLSKDDKKEADKWLGQRVIADLSDDDLVMFIEQQQG